MVASYDGGQTAPFGGIARVAFDTRTKVFVLDDLGERVVAVDLSTGRLADLARAGDGPGEIRDLVGIVSTRVGHVTLIDRAHQRMSVFDARGSVPRLEGETSLPFSPNAVCWMGGAYAMLGTYDGETFHEVDSTGKYVRPIVPAGAESEPLSTPIESMIAHERTEGSLACLGRNLIAHAPMRLGTIELINAETGEQRSVSIPGFARPVRTVRATGVRFDIDPNIGYANTVTGLTPVCGAFILSVRTDYSRESGKERTYSSWQLDPSSGVIAPADVPPSILAAHDTLALGGAVEMIPELVVWRKPPCSP